MKHLLLRQPVFALFLRSVRTDTRSLMHVFVRSLLLLSILVALIMVHLSADYLGSAGQKLFGFIISFNLVLITLSAASHFASAITEEKEERTLGLLRMTSLNGVTILLGKSSSRVFNALVLLGVQLPFTFLAHALGGVSILQIGAAYASMAAYLILLANMALFFSVICRRSRQASALTVCAWLWFLLYPWLSGQLLAASLAKGWVAEGSAIESFWVSTLDWIRSAWIAGRISEILTTGFAGSLVGYQVFSNLGAALFFFLLAWVCFEPFNRQEAPVDGSGPLDLRRIFSRGKRPPRRPWAGARPAIWRDFNFVIGGVMGLLLRSGVYGLLLGLIFFLVRDESPDREAVGSVFMVFAALVGLLEASVAGSRVFQTEIRAKTLSSLALLPTPMSETVFAKVLGCSLVLVPSVLLFASGFVLNPTGFFDSAEDLVREVVGFMFLAFWVFFPTFVAYLSLWIKRGALVTAVAVCFVGMFLFSGMLALVGLGGARFEPEDLCALVALVLGAATLAMMIHAPTRLEELAGR